VTRAVLVNGVPASGKSTLARAVAGRLSVPILELDVVKEVLFEALGHRDADRAWGRLLGRASLESIWALLAGFPPGSTVVVEAWFRLPPHDGVLRGLQRAHVDQWVEIWCHADADVLVARYAARARHPGHPAPEDYVEELRHVASLARPMALAPCLEVDTGGAAAPDLDGIVRWVTDALFRDVPRTPGHRIPGAGDS
jgi:glucokinase